MINIILEVLPLTTHTHYGTLEEFQGLFICTMHNNNISSQGSSYIWLRWLTQYSYYACLFLILVFYTRIYLNDLFPDGFFRQIIQGKIPLLNKIQSSPLMIDAKITSTLYVCAMIISWTPNAAYGSYSLNILNDQALTYNIIKEHTEIIKINDKLDILCPTYGILLSIIFYIRTKQAREEWKLIFFEIVNFCGPSSGIDIEVQSVESNWVEAAERISESELTIQKKIANNTDDDLIGIV